MSLYNQISLIHFSFHHLHKQNKLGRFELLTHDTKPLIIGALKLQLYLEVSTFRLLDDPAPFLYMSGSGDSSSSSLTRLGYTMHRKNNSSVCVRVLNERRHVKIQMSKSLIIIQEGCSILTIVLILVIPLCILFCPFPSLSLPSFSPL